MKKLLVIALGIALVFGGLTYLTLKDRDVKLKDNPYDKEDLSPETIDLIGNEDYGNIAIPSDFKEKVNAGEEFIGYFFSPTCIYCKEMTPILSPIMAEQDIGYEQFNVMEYAAEAAEYMVEGTPTTIYFKDGKEVDRIVGLHYEDEILEFINVNKN